MSTLPQANEAYTYDADGNLTSDGRWNYTWDAENRLISMQAISNVPAAAKRRLDFVYDYLGRRVQKQVYVWDSGSSSSYQLQGASKFLYDGWNLVAELDGSNGLVRSYVWGQDVSGTLQGAGGIGALLMINEASMSQFIGYDGNGNVADQQVQSRLHTNTIRSERC